MPRGGVSGGELGGQLGEFIFLTAMRQLACDLEPDGKSQPGEENKHPQGRKKRTSARRTSGCSPKVQGQMFRAADRQPARRAFLTIGDIRK